MRRVLIVSHPAVLAVNQLPYESLRRHGWDPFLVVPARWRHRFADAAFPPEVLPELRGRVVGRRVLLPGKVQRHLYLTRPGRLVAAVAPTIAFLEAEPTSAVSYQWSLSLIAADVPYGLQCDENLDRRLPLPARLFRRHALSHAAFVAARSPAAGRLLARLRPGVATPLVPHHVPRWPTPAAPGPGADRHGPRPRFVAGYAGRLVPEKGLDVLIDAAAGLDDVTVRLVGNGPLRAALVAHARERGVPLEIDTGVRHEEMAGAYAGFDVLVLPSRTTPTWSEQFGRVLVEAMSCGVPVIGSDSGEIPWVVQTTGGGRIVAEGDAVALRAELTRLRDDPGVRAALGRHGREQVAQRFSVEASAGALARALDVATERAGVTA